MLATIQTCASIKQFFFFFGRKTCSVCLETQSIVLILAFSLTCFKHNFKDMLDMIKKYLLQTFYFKPIKLKKIKVSHIKPTHNKEILNDRVRLTASIRI